jgi:hypothetical protein
VVGAVKDWRGVDVYVGDRVVYTTRQGSHMTHHEGNVLAVDGEDATVDVLRNSWGWKQRSPVKVGGRNMTVVEQLPERTDDPA